METDTLIPMPLRWRLQEFINSHNDTEGKRLTINRVVIASGLKPNTVYPIARGTSKQANLESVDQILAGLSKLTGRAVTLGEILEHQIGEVNNPSNNPKPGESKSNQE
jgi:hypothetical protein